MNRPVQPTPSVSQDDVDRIITRDFGAERSDDVAKLISAVEVRERIRVLLACLKIANGDLERLRQALSHANVDWRDVLSEAEYPLASRERSLLELQDDEARVIYESDWRQYHEWLTRAHSVAGGRS